jgi:hypothetical protein
VSDVHPGNPGPTSHLEAIALAAASLCVALYAVILVTLGVWGRGPLDKELVTEIIQGILAIMVIAGCGFLLAFKPEVNAAIPASMATGVIGYYFGAKNTPPAGGSNGH